MVRKFRMVNKVKNGNNWNIKKSDRVSKEKIR